LTTDH